MFGRLALLCYFLLHASIATAQEYVSGSKHALSLGPDAGTPNYEGYPGVVPGLPHLPPDAEGMKSGQTPVLTWPGFQILPDGSTRFFVQVLGDAQPALQEKDGQVLVVFKGGKVHLRNNQRPLITEHFNTPVTRASLERMRKGTALVLDMRQAATPILSTQAGPNGFVYILVTFPPGVYNPNATQVLAPPAPQAAPEPVAAPLAPTAPAPNVRVRASSAMDDERPPMLNHKP